MDEKDFKKHLRDLAHGKHNPAEHDWSPDTNAVTAGVAKKRPTKPAGAGRKRVPGRSPKRAAARGSM